MKIEYKIEGRKEIKQVEGAMDELIYAVPTQNFGVFRVGFTYYLSYGSSRMLVEYLFCIPKETAMEIKARQMTRGEILDELNLPA